MKLFAARSLHQFLLRNRQCFNEDVHRRLAVALVALARPLPVALGEPGIEVALQLFDRAVSFLGNATR